MKPEIKLLRETEKVYLQLIILSHANPIFAAATDHLKAKLRNAIAEFTGQDPEKVQNEFEYQAMCYERDLM